MHSSTALLALSIAYASAQGTITRGSTTLVVPDYSLPTTTPKLLTDSILTAPVETSNYELPATSAVGVSTSILSSVYAQTTFPSGYTPSSFVTPSPSMSTAYSLSTSVSHAPAYNATSGHSTGYGAYPSSSASAPVPVVSNEARRAGPALGLVGGIIAGAVAML